MQTSDASSRGRVFAKSLAALYQRLSHRGAFHGALAAAVVALGVTAAPLVHAQTAATAMIEGRVKNAVTGTYLNNARVAVKGTNLSALTDESGSYRLNDVPAGPVTLRVFFTGLDDLEATVNAAAGQTAIKDFDLTSKARYGADTELFKLDAFVVQSSRETNAATIAVNEQRVANNIKSVVATEEFGTIPDSNPGELLKWLPGVGVEYFANNIVGVNVRGLGAVNTELIFDGMPMATSNADGASSRQFEMKGASASDIARVEIRKLPLPEDSANAVGGTINLIRRSAFEYSKRKVEYTALFTSDAEKFTFAERDGPKDRKQQYWQPNWQLKWTEPVNKNFGLAFTAGQTNTIVRVHWNNPTWNYGTAAQKTQAEADMAAGRALTTVSLYNPAMTQMLLHDAPTKDSRDYTSMRVDWRPFREFVAGYSFAYTKFYSQQADDVRYTWNNAATGSGDPQFVDRRTLLGRIGGGSIQYNTPLWRDINQPTLAHNLEATWKHENWTLSLKGALSQSKYYIASTSHGFFNSTSGGGVPATGVGSGTGNPKSITIKFTDIDYRGPRGIEAYTTANGLASTSAAAYNVPVDWSSAATAGIGGAVDRPGRSKDDVTASKVYLRRDFDFKNPLTVQIGYDYAEQYRNRRYAMNVWKFVGKDHIAATADDSASAIAADALTRSGDTWAHTPALDHISLSKLYKLYQDHPDYFVYDDNQSFRNTVTNPLRLTETTTAPYVEFFQKLFNNRMQIAGGVRWEKADADAIGYLLDQSAAYQKYSDGTVKHANDVVGANGLPTTRAGAPVFLPGVTSGSFQEALLTMKENAAHGHGVIKNSFPSLHLAYDLTDNLKLQVGWAKTQAKNRFDRTVVPNTTVNDTPQSLNGAIGVVNVRNPNLQPWIGYNYETRLSYYSRTGGNIAVSAWRKSIHNWQASFTDYLATPQDAADYGLSAQYVGYNASTMYNSGNARIDGAEFEMRQSFDPLLGRFGDWARGFTASSTYSYTNLKGQAPNSDLGSVYDYRGTFYLHYAKRKVSASVGYIRNGPNANGVPTGAGVTGIQVQAPQDMFDFSFEYRYRTWGQLFISGRNILKEWRLREARIPGAPNYALLNSSTNLGATITIGLKGTF